MFGNFIYFIIVLLVYATYPMPAAANFDLFGTCFLFIGLIVLFVLLTRNAFMRIKNRAGHTSATRLDYFFSAAVVRQSILAIVLFTINIYGLALPFYLNKIRFFTILPTLEAFMFIGLFVFYLTVVWYCAHPVYRRIYNDKIPRKSYIGSNISISIPVILPWATLSLLYDLILLLPFDATREILIAPEGRLIYFLSVLLTVSLGAPALIQRFWRCKPLEDGVLRQRIDALCKQTRVNYKDILYWPIFGGRMITAGVMGLVARFRYILLTKALTAYLDPDEIDAVIAHEIGHVKKRHLLYYLMFFVGFMPLVLLTEIYLSIGLQYFESLGPIVNYRFHGGEHIEIIEAAIICFTYIFLFLTYFRFIFGFFMRNFERQADLFALQLFRTPKPLISTFNKIVLASGQPPDKPNWHHFSISQRIAYLKKSALDPVWIKRHERKIKHGIRGYLIAVTAIILVGFNIDTTPLRQRIIANVKTNLTGIDYTNVNKPAKLMQLAGILFEIEEYARAIQVFEKSLQLEPDNAEALNGLAWLFATSKDPYYRNPERALVLARKAVELDASPHILDTLAESYFVNGQIQKAIELEEKVLELVGSGAMRTIFEEQLKKFRQAAQE